MAKMMESPVNGTDKIIKKAKTDLLNFIKQYTAKVKDEPLDKTCQTTQR